MAAEFAADASFTADEQFRIMARQYVFDDSESQTDATAIVLASSFVDTKETLGKARHVLSIDTLSGIGNNQVCAISAGEPADRDFCRPPAYGEWHLTTG